MNIQFLKQFWEKGAQSKRFWCPEVAEDSTGMPVGQRRVGIPEVWQVKSSPSSSTEPVLAATRLGHAMPAMLGPRARTGPIECTKPLSDGKLSCAEDTNFTHFHAIFAAPAARECWTMSYVLPLWLFHFIFTYFMPLLCRNYNMLWQSWCEFVVDMLCGAMWCSVLRCYMNINDEDAKSAGEGNAEVLKDWPEFQWVGKALEVSTTLVDTTCFHHVPQHKIHKLPFHHVQQWTQPYEALHCQDINLYEPNAQNKRNAQSAQGSEHFREQVAMPKRSQARFSFIVRNLSWVGWF